MSNSSEVSSGRVSPLVALAGISLHVLVWIAFAFYLLVIVPRHRVAFEDMVVEIPVFSQLVIDASTFATTFWPVFILPVMLWLAIHAIVFGWMRANLPRLSWGFLACAMAVPIGLLALCMLAMSLV